MSEQPATEVNTVEKKSARSRRSAKPAPELTEEERLEIELGERARLSSDSGEGVAPGKADNFKVSFLRMLGLLKPYTWALVAVTIMGAAGVVLTVLAPKVLGNATNVVFEGFISRQLPAGVTQDQAVEGLRAAGENRVADMISAMEELVPGQGIDFDRLGQLLVTVLALYVAGAFLTWAQGYVINVVMVRAMWRLRDQVEDKINRLPLAYFDKVQRGELISRVTNDIDNITQTMQQSLSTALTSILTVIGVLVMMFSISGWLALVALVSLPLMGVIFGVVGPRSQKAFGIQWRKVGRLNARVEESFSGHALVKVYGRKKDFQDKFKAENEELYQASFKAQFLSGIIWPGMSFVGNLTYVGIAVLGGLMVANGSMRLGSVQAFIQYTQMFTQPLSELGGMAAVVQSGTASAERVFALLDEDEQEPDAVDAPAPVDGDGTIEFDHVHFSYDPEHPLIEDLSFEVHPGQTVAIVGPTGAGKTTLVNLLMRFYELDGGRPGHRHAVPARRPRPHRHGAAGPVAVLRLHHGEHPLRPADRHRRGGARRRAGHLRRPVRALAPRGLRHRAGGGRREPVGGGEAADHHRPGVRLPAVGAHPGRGDLVGGHPHRAAAAAGDGLVAGRADVLRDRPPALHHPGRRPDPGDGARRDR